MNQIYFNLPKEISGAVSARLEQWQMENIVERVWNRDPSVWKKESENQNEIANRLGWLDLPERMMHKAESLQSFAAEIKDLFDDALVLGMGGSSLAPEVFAKTFGSKAGYPKLRIVDSTHPAVIKEFLNSYDLRRTLFLVSSKSGGTAETSSFFQTFYSALHNLGVDAGKNFIALTDKGSGLERLALEKKFLKIFNTDPEVGGRYSALIEFGMLPAALIGMDVDKFLKEAGLMEMFCKPDVSILENPGFMLGAVLGELALRDINKVTFYTSADISSFPQWAEQLIAESTGKEGKGIVPIADEPHGSINHYSQDRVFVYMQTQHTSIPEFINHLILEKRPLIHIILDSLPSLAQEFYRWEMATAAASIALGINPFDQPDVQLAKTLANESLAAYRSNGSLPQQEPHFTSGAFEFHSEVSGNTPKEILHNFLMQKRDADYLGILAFLPYENAINKSLQNLRASILRQYGLPTTLGYGPRFLHSTGQLHKGGADNGMFIQFVDNVTNDEPVPNLGYSFGTLVTAQALGDAKALEQRSRRLLKIKITSDSARSLAELI